MVVTSPGLEARQEAQMRLAIGSISRIIAAACVWAPAAAFAQAPESSEVVPKGGFHFESGISYEGDTVGGDRSRSSVAVIGRLTGRETWCRSRQIAAASR